MFHKMSAGFFLKRVGLASLLAGLLLFAGGAQASSAAGVYASGYDQNGELGDGGGASHSIPQAVSILEGNIPAPVLAVAAGASHSLALTTGGFVYAWGLNNYGQLGDGTTTTRTQPVLVTLANGSPLTNIIAISGGFSHSLALTADGTVYAWGYNLNGQLADGTTTPRSHPTLIANFSGVVAIAAGGYHSLALTGDGTVYAWGYNSFGQLGIGAKDFTAHTVPAAVPNLNGITAIAGGGYHSLALNSSGAVSAWGENNFGQLGDGTATNRPSPVPVLAMATLPLGGVTGLAAGVYHSALLTGGRVYGAGYNGYGQLGDGTTVNRSFPVSTSLTNVQTVAAGGYTTLALSAGGSYGWGQNNYGQLADGTTANRTVPTAAISVGAVGAIAGGGSHTLFVQAAFASVSGTLAFEGIAPTASSQNVTFLFVPNDASARLTRLAAVPANGVFTLSGLPQKTYTVWIKGTKYLAATATADASAGNVSGLTAAQGAGDSNNDNSVDPTDFNNFVTAYNSDSSVPGSGYDPTSDFNGDGLVDPTDFGLFVGEYNNAGAPIP